MPGGMEMENNIPEKKSFVSKEILKYFITGSARSYEMSEFFSFLGGGRGEGEGGGKQTK